MKRPVILSRIDGTHKRLSLPRPLWSGRESLETGLVLLAVYVRRSGDVIALTYSYFEDRRTHAQIGPRYVIVSEDNFPEHVLARIRSIASA